MESMMGRREVLRGLFAGLAALFGVGAASWSLPAAGARSRPTRLQLQGVDWHRFSVSSDAGLPPAPGERAVMTGILVGGDGVSVGTFRSVSFFGGPLWSDNDAPSLEFHTFEVGADAIFGLGQTGEGGGVFAVAGGTGRFAGSRGSYVAEQAPYETGGDGTARFTFTFM